ncbi:MAG: hypothetical protein ACKOAH_15635, partial [Pirellula sp.]
MFLATYLLISMLGISANADDILIADFEGDTYETWTVTGDAFGPGPAKGTLPGQMHVDGFRGKALVNSFFQGDNSIGIFSTTDEEGDEFPFDSKFWGCQSTDGVIPLEEGVDESFATKPVDVH